ncbi:hypothetical protein JL721_8300 [Aureococcus anophagefferens]|nr:hypothetical protein JL721_8300 [Aureococcus anophagefferens]
MSFKDFLASKSKAPSQPLWLTSVEGAAPRVEPPPAPPPPPPPPKPRTFRSKLACQASAPCRCRAPPPESCPPAPREASTSPPEAPLVSVICPTTLRRRALHGLLYDNFVAQDHERKELLVLDSGGADPSPFFAALDDPRVRYAYVPSDGDGSGDERPEFCPTAAVPGNKRNRLVEASGDVVVCMDDDNLYAPSYVSTMVAHLLASGHDLVTLGAFYVASPTKGADGRYASARGAYASDWWDGTVFADEGDERGAARGETMVFRKRLYGKQKFLEDAPVGEEGPMVPPAGASHGVEDDAVGIFVHVDHGANCSGDLMLGADGGRPLPAACAASAAAALRKHAAAYDACLDLELAGGNPLVCGRRAVGMC